LPTDPLLLLLLDPLLLPDPPLPPELLPLDEPTCPPELLLLEAAPLLPLELLPAWPSVCEPPPCAFEPELDPVDEPVAPASSEPKP
jgi:hypothetical protein